MNTHPWNRVLIACLFTVAAVTVRADEEQELIATLQSAAGVPQKCSACQKLRIIGTARSVPALAALLGEERTAHAARYALEALPGPEAGAALREALGKTSGAIKGGLIDSLGWRRDSAAVPLLAPLVSDADAMLASAAASALGRIGGPEASATLSAARDKAGPAVQPAVLEGLLQCAERLLAGKDSAGAAALYRSLCGVQFPPQIRAAAWRGLTLSDTSQRVELVTQGLAGADKTVRLAALQLVRELSDPQVIEACRRQWASLPAESQLALLDAQLKCGGEALPLVRATTESPHEAVRIAAWQALAELDAPATIPALAKAAADGQPAERVAARDALARMPGSGVREALLAEIKNAAPPAKAELLRVLGDRGDAGAVGVLLQHASADAEPLRLAALDSLRKLAAEDSIAPLLALVGKAQADAERELTVKAIAAACQASRSRDQAARRVIEAIQNTAAAQRRPLLALLSALATPEALNVACTAARDKDSELAKEAVRVLADWPNAAPAPHLLELAGSSTDVALHTLAVRGAVKVAAQEPDAGQRIALLQRAITAAKRAEEKRQALGQLGQVQTLPALEAVLPYLADRDLVNEAAAAAVGIAEKLVDSHPQQAEAAAAKILAHCQAAQIVRRALALRGRPKSGPFLRDWLVCGPYSQAGVTGAVRLFPIAFGPEKPNEKVQWRPAPPADMINLSGIFPGKTDCVAYLKTNIIAPQDCSAQLLLGSDDGVQAWLNGAVVHSNNIDRFAVPDQDRAPIKLKQGANLLMLKITQGGGGWLACTRVVSLDGQPIPGLRCDPQSAAAPSAAAR
jgi:HEAT repeat protein